jgi:tRNA (guanine-N7-)-methyltransferase
MQSEVSADLKIKTHYESLDIAGSNRIHYLSFSIPPSLSSTEKDLSFKEKLAQHETTTEN